MSQNAPSRTFAADAFAGKRVLITGAGGGIGAVSAQMFAESGASLILIDLTPESVARTATSLPDGTEVVQLAGDVTDPAVLASIVDAVGAAGGVDHLVLAAGIYTEHPVDGMSDAFWSKTIAVNLEAVFHLTRDLLPHLRDGGSIVNFGSLAGSRGSRNHAHYAATKGALVSFGRSLSWELGSRDIRVNAVAPGIITTAMTDQLVASGGDALLKATPLGRFGTADEIAGVVLFLCSDAASFITGETIQINGGLHMA